MTIFWNMDMSRIQYVIPSESFMSALDQNFWSSIPVIRYLRLFFEIDLGLSFPKIRNSDDNLKLINFLRLSIFGKHTWTDEYVNQHNISIFGEKNDLSKKNLKN